LPSGIEAIQRRATSIACGSRSNTCPISCPRRAPASQPAATMIPAKTASDRAYASGSGIRRARFRRSAIACRMDATTIAPKTRISTSVSWNSAYATATMATPMTIGRMYGSVARMVPIVVLLRRRGLAVSTARDLPPFHGSGAFAGELTPLLVEGTAERDLVAHTAPAVARSPHDRARGGLGFEDRRHRLRAARERATRPVELRRVHRRQMHHRQMYA
jgi:hypothetical protein